MTTERPDMTKVTPRPWHLVDGYEIGNWRSDSRYKGGVREEHVVCVGHDYDEGGSLTEADAAFIVYAVNTIEATEARLAEAVRLLKLVRLTPKVGAWDAYKETLDRIDRFLDAADREEET